MFFVYLRALPAGLAPLPDKGEKFGGGLGGSLGGKMIENLDDFLKLLKDAGSACGIKFEGCNTIWDIEGPDVEISGTAAMFHLSGSFGKSQTSENTSAISGGVNKFWLEFHAVITGTKLLYTLQWDDLKSFLTSNER